MNMRGHPIFGVVLSTLFILVVTIWPLVKVGPLEWAIHGSQLVLLSLLLVSMPIHTIRAPRDAAIIPRWLHWGILISFLAFFVLFPFAAGSYLYWRHIAIVAGITIIAVLGLNVLVGLCGEISLAQGAFIGMGAFVSGTLATTLALPFGIALSAATLLTALVGLILGLSCIRLTGLWLAFATLVAQFVIFFAINRMLPGLLGGKRELMIPASLMPERVPFFLVVATLMIMTIVLVELLARFKIGVRTTLARDDQSTNGTSNPRILGFVVSSFCAGLAGSLSMYFYGGMIPELFPWTYAVYSLWCLGIVIIGGPGTILGVIGAVMIFFQYQEGFRPVTTLGMSFQQGLLGCSIVLLLFSSAGQFVRGCVHVPI